MSLIDIVDDKKPERKPRKKRSVGKKSIYYEKDYSNEEFSFNILDNTDPRAPMDCPQCGNISFGVEGIGSWGSLQICSNPFCKHSIFNICERKIQKKAGYSAKSCEELDLVEIQCSILDHKKRSVIV